MIAVRSFLLFLAVSVVAAACSGDEEASSVNSPSPNENGGDGSVLGTDGDGGILSNGDGAPQYGFPHEEFNDVAVTVGAGTRKKIYDPSRNGDAYYINDHTFVKDKAGTWHLFGITHKEPAAPLEEIAFAHATASTLTQAQWKREADALTASPAAGENLIWAPHVIFNDADSTYYMYYAAGRFDGANWDHAHWKMQLATSKDLTAWARKGTLFEDGWDARDPFITKIGTQWVMYYCATLNSASPDTKIVAYRTSTDLQTWSARKTAFYDPTPAPQNAETESPFVLKRGDAYYLFLSIRGAYSSTDVFKSTDPLKFTAEQIVGRIDAHAGEVVADDEGSLYFSHSGWEQGGVWLAPLYFEGDKVPGARALRVATPTYDALIRTAPRTEIISLAVSPSGSAPRNVLDSAPRGTGPYIGAAAFGATDRAGAAAKVEWGNDGRALTLREIPIGSQPVKVDWSFDFADETFDTSLVWNVASPISVKEASFAIDATLSVFESDGKPRTGDVSGFSPFTMVSDANVTLVTAYKKGSAFRTTNHYVDSFGHFVAWQYAFGGAGKAMVPAGALPGGHFRFGASNKGADLALGLILYDGLSK